MSETHDWPMWHETRDAAVGTGTHIPVQLDYTFGDSNSDLNLDLE